MDAEVRALTVYNDQLIAGGVFEASGGAPLNFIAVWDGSVWSNLDTGVGGGFIPIVYSLTVFDNKLIAGGGFLTAGGTSAKGVASWNGLWWSALGSGVGGIIFPTVQTLTAYGNRLFVGGGFTTAGGATAYNCASWDGSSWWTFYTSCCFGRVGDADNSGDDEPTLSDVSTLIDALFISSDPDKLECMPEADVNQSGGASPTFSEVTLGDVSALIEYLFIKGPYDPISNPTGAILPDCL